eukprot:3022670-Prorocentrum_lima.AAC.1
MTGCESSPMRHGCTHGVSSHPSVSGMGASVGPVPDPGGRPGRARCKRGRRVGGRERRGGRVAR